MRIAKIEKNSIANGPGVRLVVWCQGCSIHCPGCHNQSTWDPFAGREITKSDVQEIISYLKNDYVRGITLSGGHPLEDYNIDYAICLLQYVRECCPDKDVWLYTGLRLNYSNFTDNSGIAECLSLCDVVVDGPYIESERCVTSPYFGSNNQRVIDVSKTYENKEITLWKEQ